MNKEQSEVRDSLLSKVPEITLFFWVIKVLCTTVGETAADFLNVNLNFGLTLTSIITGLLLLIALFFQLRTRQYIPSVYWIAVVLISVFGTLVTDNLTDSMGVPLEASTIFFSIALGATFLLWYRKEKTLSIHSIFTRRRELFYWLAILFTFALGTAAGDLMAEGLGLGYVLTGIIVAVTIAVAAILWRMGLNAILAFWIIYILTRPLGASLGDFLSQPTKYGGLDLGATLTSIIFLLAILGTVAYLTFSRKDVITKAVIREEEIGSEKSVLFQVVGTVCVLMIASLTGYAFRSNTLTAEVVDTTLDVADQEVAVTEDIENTKVIPTDSATTSDTDVTTPTTGVANVPVKPVASTSASAVPKPIPQPAYPLGNVSAFKTITTDTLTFVNQGDMSGAKTRISDLEYEWDNAEAKLKPMNKAKWTEVDDAIDAALRQVRSVHPDATKCRTALEALLATLK